MTRCLESRSRTLETEGKRRSESTFPARGASDLGFNYHLTKLPRIGINVKRVFPA